MDGWLGGWTVEGGVGVYVVVVVPSSLSRAVVKVKSKATLACCRFHTCVGYPHAHACVSLSVCMCRSSLGFLLQAEGFSQDIIDRFFRPFLGGIFFNTELTTSSRLFEFVMRMLATGSNCLPAGGIGALAEQLASRLPADSIYTGQAVAISQSVSQGQSVSHCCYAKQFFLVLQYVLDASLTFALPM